MISPLNSAACLAALALAVPAFAQPASSAQPPAPSATAAPAAAGTPDPAATAATAPASPSASGVDASATASGSVMSGMSVKDNTGALIGEVTAVKPDATGQQLATIKMGADVFTVETSKLALKDGAATINATQAELRKMMPKK